MRLFFVLLALALSGAAQAASGAWTGTWDTRWREGGARLELRQEGDRIDGRYAAYNGTVDGTVSGRVLKGQWHQGDKSGGFDFVMAPDGRSFIGRYESGEWWTGARASADADGGGTVDLSTPRAAMRTFLHGGNAARYDAPDEMVAAVAAVDFGGATLAPEVKLARTKALFDLVDATTFRLFTVPDRADGDRTTVTLRQAGTTAEMPVTFAKTGDAWRLAMPDETALANLGRGLYARTGGHPPGPDDYKLRRDASAAYRTFTHAFFAWNDGGRAQALSALDLSAIPQAIRDYQGELAALYLANVLDRVGLLEPQEVPDDPASAQPFILFSHPAGQIVIAPTVGASPRTWAFTPETVRNVRNLFVVVEDLPAIAGGTLPIPPSSFFALRQHVRDLAPSLLADLGPLEIWQALGWAAVLAISLGVGLVAAEAVMRLFLAVFGSGDAVAERRTFRFAVWGAIAFSVYKLLIPAIGLEDVAKQVSVGVTGVLLVASLMWLGWITVDALGNRFFGTRDGARFTMDNIVVSLLFGLLKLALVVIGLTLIAVELSLPYEGIVASLSIGGLAVAFASRETLSNVFGAGVLAIDRPFKRGDAISAGGVDGTVEHVGIRSTRIRTKDDSVVVVPNGKLSDANVNNLDSRRYHLGSLKVPVPFSTPPGRIEELIRGAREIVAQVPEIAAQKTSVTLSTVDKDRIQLALNYSLDAKRGGNDALISNTMLLDIMRLCERLDVKL